MSPWKILELALGAQKEGSLPPAWRKHPWYSCGPETLVQRQQLQDSQPQALVANPCWKAR